MRLSLIEAVPIRGRSVYQLITVWRNFREHRWGRDWLAIVEIGVPDGLRGVLHHPLRTRSGR